MFDSCAFYGHNEVDLQAIGDPRYVLGIEFVDMYKNEVGASEPQEDFHDRHELYGIRNNVVVAAICPDQVQLLDKAKETMQKLLEKFPAGYEGFCRNGDHEAASSTTGVLPDDLDSGTADYRVRTGVWRYICE
ncbi:Uu.00g035210.m01.CDS01 [Anthostomella pinea]|uniref:Uu.00g035210.m01.CDS01 n=1 Tax=Anthostomella pinea TaxID=933095 RepID=A0AAI8V9A6_9PEZI|nr:Uu.00g035210.m01.CDS01 [Anthostomella pinea]